VHQIDASTLDRYIVGVKERKKEEAYPRDDSTKVNKGERGEKRACTEGKTKGKDKTGRDKIMMSF
jgi:hypothetical protein